MEIQTYFTPARRVGLAFIFGSAMFLGGLAAEVFLQVYQQGTGSGFVLGILVAVLLAAPLPLLAYRAYSLAQGHYVLDRDGLLLRWGMRAEDIPLPEIEWVRPADELGFRLPLPFLWVPGVIVGTRRVEGLGPVEFLAANSRHLLLVATPKKIYAISPADQRAFVRSFSLITELGSLTPILPASVLPAAFARRVWQDKLGRGLLLAGLGLSVFLFVLAALTIPGRDTISLGYDALRRPLEPISADRLLLLPVLNGVAYVLDLVVGLFFYRRKDQAPLAYILWASSLLTPFLLLLAILWMH